LNKKQKILTLLALAAFSVIIVMHCMDKAGHWQMYYHFVGPAHNRLYSSARPVLEDVFGQVEKLLRCSKPTALKEMEALTVLGVADKTEGDAEYGRPEHELRLAEKFQWFATDECKGLRWQ
jgi:hypothetical protein